VNWRRARIVAIAASVLTAAFLTLLPLAGPASAAPTRYEAESATLSQGVVESNHTGFSGTGFVNYDNVTGSYVQWTVSAASAGTATIGLRFANGTTVNRPMTITVNGTAVATAQAFNSTGTWDTWQTATITAPVNAGSNTIRATATTANGGPNVDWLEIDVAATTPSTDYQAEDATISQGTVATNHTGFTGTGFVDYTNVTGSYVEWTVTQASAGQQTLTLRYANGTTVNRPMTITVNGTAVATNMAFNGTANWDTWADATLTASLNAGINTIRATATTANGGPNVDRLRVTGGGGGEGEPPTVPGNLRSTGVTSSSASLAWDASTDNTGVVGYDVYNGSALATSVTGTTATVTGLAAGTSYTFTVKARDAAGNISGPSNAVTVTTSGGTTGPSMAVAPYEYFGWGNPQSPTAVMSATGIRFFTLAFMLSDGGCNPLWDGSRPLAGGDDQSKINAIRGAGGDVIVSFGGWSGNKLGEHCSSASALAGAYQKVINAYSLKAIDIDIEATEFSNGTVRQRVVDALKTVKANNPGLKTFITFGTTPTGPDATGKDLINKGAAAGLNNDGWTIMPFDFGGHSGSMGSATVSAAEGLKNAVKSAYGYSDAVAYSKIGISSMNGKTDESDETVSTGDFQTILGYAQQHHIARLTFWSINRDRACGSGSDADSCSGVSQQPYAYTKILVQYAG
jgi:chitinase